MQEGFGVTSVGSLGSTNTELCRSALSGILRSVEWYFRTDVSRQLIRSHLQGSISPRKLLDP